MREIDHEYTREIVCPWCGYEFSDSWEVDSNEQDLGLQDCPDCEKTFEAHRNIEVTYSTDKCDYGKCLDCGKDDVVLTSLCSSMGKYENLCVDCGKLAHDKMLSEYMERLKANAF